MLAACGGDGLDRLADGGRGRVADALSGEVLLLEDGREVRLAGLHAPGEAAERALGALTEGREVSLLHGGERVDPYGRVAAHVRLTRSRRWVQRALLDDGLARVRTTREEAALAAEMLQREARARAQGRGLWADAAQRVRLPAEVSAGTTGFLIVEGRVRGTDRTRDRTLFACS